MDHMLKFMRQNAKSIFIAQRCVIRIEEEHLMRIGVFLHQWMDGIGGGEYPAKGKSSG